ncbi:MAG: PASTA domain-containing protein, partial [Oscillospiraceae bacterium]
IATAKSRLEAADLTCEVIGNGTNVVGQLPARGSSIPRGGKIILYTEDNYEEEFVAVPNLYGKDLNQANQLLAQKGLNLKTSGPAKRDGALVSSQNYAEGANVSKGTIIEVTFSIKDQY